jgi:subtilisin-like proprotein convertase family protein
MKKTILLALIVLILRAFVNDASAYMFWNQACRFNGAPDSSHVSIVNSASLNITGSFTIECWVNPVNVITPNLQMILQKGSGASGYSLLLNSGRVTIRTNSTPRLVGKTSIPSNQWTHIAGTYNSATNVFAIYIDGSLDTSVTIAGAIPAASTDSLFIGKGANNPYTGLMDEVRLWNRALSSTRINTNKRTTLGSSGGIYNGIVLSLTFQDKESTGGDFVLTDWSGNNNNGINRGVSAVNLNNRPSTTIAPNESIELDGTNDYLAGPDNSDISPTSALTLETYIFPRDGIGGGIIHKGPAGGGANTNYRLQTGTNNTISAIVNGDSGFISNSSLPLNQWSHVAFTYNGSSGAYKFYVNGRLTISGSNPVGNITNGSDSLYIGGTTVLPCFNGFIDEVRISNYVKSQLQINNYLYQSIDSENAPNPSGVNVVYNLDGYSLDNAGAGPRLYFRNNASFSNPGTTDNQPVSPLDRSNVLNFQDGFYLKSSGKLIGPTGITYDTLDLFYDKTIQDINLFVALNHSDESNLEISLIAPNGDEVKVFDNNTLVANSDNIITIFDDQSDSSLVNSRYVSFGPSIKPLNNMNSMFAGDNFLGKWILKVNDQSGVDTGRLYAWGLQVNNKSLKVPCLKMSVLIQGLVFPSDVLNGNNGGSATKIDSVKCGMNNSTPPYSQVDVVQQPVPDTSRFPPPPPPVIVFPSAAFEFASAVVEPGIAYYIKVTHRNSIETWSSGFITFDFLSNMAEYNMVSLKNSAYGSNMIQVQSNPNWFAMFSGDVNQDGTIDITDLSLIENASTQFLMGYVPEDLNGDNFVDLSDALIAENNAYNFVSVIRP